MCEMALNSKGVKRNDNNLLHNNHFSIIKINKRFKQSIRLHSKREQVKYDSKI